MPSLAASLLSAVRFRRTASQSVEERPIHQVTYAHQPCVFSLNSSCHLPEIALLCRFQRETSIRSIPASCFRAASFLLLFRSLSSLLPVEKSNTASKILRLRKCGDLCLYFMVSSSCFFFLREVSNFCLYITGGVKRRKLRTKALLVCVHTRGCLHG